jgi:hypothetical protein
VDSKNTISVANLQSNYPEVHKPSDDNEINLSEEFDAMISRICILLDLPVTDQAAIIQNHLMLIDDVLVSLELEEWSSHVKMYLDVGLPLTTHEEELHGLLLDRQANFPTPFMMAVARNPDNKRIMLIAFAPLTLDAESDYVVVHALTAAVLTAKGLREELSLAGELSA